LNVNCLKEIRVKIIFYVTNINFELIFLEIVYVDIHLPIRIIIVTIAIKSVVIAINRDKEDNNKYNKEDNNNYDCTTIVFVFSLASFIEKMHTFYNLFFAL